MKLRRGKTKILLEGSIEAALLAVEVYNKPRTTFRSQAYIVLMIIAWTRLFHAYFNKTIGNRYYYKERGRYQYIDGQQKAWDLKTCINKYERYGSLSEAVKANLQFFIGLRNKIEHHNVAEREVDTSIFEECQAFLFNYENLLIGLFGSEYAINESLAFSLQFSHMRTREQEQASKNVLSAEMGEIQNYIEDYRSNLSQEVLNSREYWIKLIPTPKISNTKRGDLSVEFVRLDELDPVMHSQITGIIKDKKVLVEAKNAGKFLPGKVVEKVKEATRLDFNLHHHRCLYTVFSVRPPGKDPNPENTNTKYCHYDSVNMNYVYQENWVEIIVKLFEIHHLTIEKIHQAYKNDEKWDINKYC